MNTMQMTAKQINARCAPALLALAVLGTLLLATTAVVALGQLIAAGDFAILALLNHFSTLELILLLVGGPTLLAVGGCLIVQRTFPRLGDSEFDKMSETLRGGFTVLFGLILGLSIASVSTQLSAARATVSSEAAALAQMMRASRALPADDQAAITQAMDEYVHAVADDEWVMMQRGLESPRAAAALEQLYAVYTDHPPQPGPFASSRFSAAMSKLDQVTAARRTRLQQATAGSSLPDLLRILLMIGVVVFIVVWYPVKIRDKRAQLVVVACIAAFISFAYLLTVLLDFPFAGDLAVGNAPFKEGALAAFWLAQ